MARSIYSGSPSPISPSPSLSDSDSESLSTFTDQPNLNARQSISRANSPGSSQLPDINEGQPFVEDSVTCEWDGCGKVYSHLPTLIEHIHNDHIGVHKSSYSCEWASCTRRGLAQTSRFALISHIRSHTGEKPFICTLPECDKSFTRSDALAKHMRLQHNISPPAPGRGGSRKRKRNGADEPRPASSSRPSDTQGNDLNLRWASSRHQPPHGPNSDHPSSSSFSQFKIEPHTPSELEGSAMFEGGAGGGYFGGRDNGAVNGHGPAYAPSPSSHPSSLLLPNHRPPSPESPSVLDLLPQHLLSRYDESTGTILGRTPYQIMYLLTKAKFKYAKDQQDELLEELRVAESEMRRVTEAKERMVDDLLRAIGGPEAEQFILPIPGPPDAKEMRRDSSPHGAEHGGSGHQLGVNGNGY